MNKQIFEVLRYIEFNLDDDLDIETLSKVAGYSPFHFCRLFKLSLGYSVLTYINNIRMLKASSNILNSKKSIIEIALDIGFKTPNGFNKAFKKVFNISPREYRKRHLSMLLSYKENRMNSPVIKQRNSTFVMYVSQYGDYEKSSNVAWEELTKLLNEKGKKQAAVFLDSELLGFCHHDPETTPSEDIRYDAAISCNQEDFNNFEPLGFKSREVPQGNYASITYKGDKNAMKVWRDLYAWILEEDLQCKDMPAFEKYTNWSYGMNKDDLIVEVYVALK
jgi:AraC family transcriptional regulator